MSCVNYCLLTQPTRVLIRGLVSRKDHESEQEEDWASENKLQVPFPEEHICESVRHS